MYENLFILIGTLGGALIGSSAGFLGIWIKERQETKRNKSKLIIESAIKEWSQIFENLSTSSDSSELMPLSCYILSYSLILEYIHNTKKFDMDEFKKVLEKSDDIVIEMYKNNLKMNDKFKDLKKI